MSRHGLTAQASALGAHNLSLPSLPVHGYSVQVHAVVAVTYPGVWGSSLMKTWVGGWDLVYACSIRSMR